MSARHENVSGPRGSAGVLGLTSALGLRVQGLGFGYDRWTSAFEAKVVVGLLLCFMRLAFQQLRLNQG